MRNFCGSPKAFRIVPVSDMSFIVTISFLELEPIVIKLGEADLD